jgi:hypothetical protein
MACCFMARRKACVNSPLNQAAGGNIDLRGCLGPKEGLFAHDIPGLFARYVKGLTITDFKLTWDTGMTQPYFSNGIELEHVGDLSIRHFTGKGAPHNPEAVPVKKTSVLP